MWQWRQERCCVSGGGRGDDSGGNGGGVRGNMVVMNVRKDVLYCVERIWTVIVY